MNTPYPMRTHNIRGFCLWAATWANERTLAYYPRLSMKKETEGGSEANSKDETAAAHH